MKLSIIVPALNEEKNILSTIDNCLSALNEFNIDGEIVVINDGSSDSTPNLVGKKIKENPGRVRTLLHEKPMGIGFSFWDGVDNALGESVVMIPGDNENDPKEILRYFNLLNDVDIVVPFVYNKEVRSLSRNALSSFFTFFINFVFSTNFKYTNGTNLYRRSLLKELKRRSGSFFFQADILIRLAGKGYLFAEVPYKLNLRRGGNSKLISFRSFLKVAKECLHLFWEANFKKGKIKNDFFSQDSLTALRKKKD